MRLSYRVKQLKSSATLTTKARAKALRDQGREVLDLSTGEPDFGTPEPICEAAREAIASGFTKYTAVAGIPELREAAAKDLSELHGVEYTPGEVMITSGAKFGLYVMIQALLDPGDEVLILSPYWVSYPAQVEQARGESTFIPTTAANRFVPDPKDLEKAITPYTWAIIINSPNNPSGAVYGDETLSVLAEIAIKHRLWVITDDVYEKLTYDGVPYRSILHLRPDLKNRTVVINAVSKTYAMTGWRIGYVGAPEPLLKAAANIQGASTSGVCSIAQRAALAALSMPNDSIEVMRAEFEQRRDLVIAALNGIPDVTCPTPTGAFYAFPDLSAYMDCIWKGEPIGESVRMADFLLETALAATVAGGAFGADNNIRISYATDRQTLTKAMERIPEALAGLREGRFAG